jgi:Putative prokaryotic signal transducing protein
VQDKADGEFRLVFQGFDPTEAGMLARLLEAEGIACRHLGSQHPAALGVGEFACEQRLEVPSEDLERARELIAAANAGVDEMASSVSGDQDD